MKLMQMDNNNGKLMKEKINYIFAWNWKKKMMAGPLVLTEICELNSEKLMYISHFHYRQFVILQSNAAHIPII
jgi:hypothetical protein